VILVDDMIDTGHTLTLAANVLAEKGAKSVHALISHGSTRSLSNIVLCTYPALFPQASFLRRI